MQNRHEHTRNRGRDQNFFFCVLAVSFAHLRRNIRGFDDGVQFRENSVKLDERDMVLFEDSPEFIEEQTLSAVRLTRFQFGAQKTEIAAIVLEK